MKENADAGLSLMRGGKTGTEGWYHSAGDAQRPPPAPLFQQLVQHFQLRGDPEKLCDGRHDLRVLAVVLTWERKTLTNII